MDPEVRYHMLRPAQVVARRQACPVLYIPIGTIEWHGVHNPLGADTLQAEGLAILCAQQGGELVFPPLYYGENRLEALMEANAGDRDQIAASMALSPDNFTPERQAFTATEQALNYHKLLLHILVEAETLGFAVGVLVAGHYPLIDPRASGGTPVQPAGIQQAPRDAGLGLRGLPARARSLSTGGRPRGGVGDLTHAGSASPHRGLESVAAQRGAVGRRRRPHAAAGCHR